VDGQGRKMLPMMQLPCCRCSYSRSAPTVPPPVEASLCSLIMAIMSALDRSAPESAGAFACAFVPFPPPLPPALATIYG
jgi:hypothetical protein